MDHKDLPRYMVWPIWINLDSFFHMICNSDHRGYVIQI